jgi:Tol biopolymer transport system component
VAPLDPHTLLYAASSTGPSGERLWALDLDSRKSRPVTTGVERYLTVAASADGRNIVATVVANPDARLWSLPLGDEVAGDRDVQVFPVPSARALQPRIRGASLFYLSSGGVEDGLWHLENGQLSEVWKGSDGALRGPAAVSQDGTRVAIVLRKEGRGYLKILTKDGSNSRDVPSPIDVKGVPDWGPDDNSIVTGGADARGEGLFIIPIDGGTPRRLTNGFSTNPVCSADGSIVYAGPNVTGNQPLLGVRPDGTAVPLPPIFVQAPFARHRFVPGGKRLLNVQSQNGYDDFWMLDLLTRETRQVAHVTGQYSIWGFDITPDGKRIVFDRHHENSNIVLIERPRKP